MRKTVALAFVAPLVISACGTNSDDANGNDGTAGATSGPAPGETSGGSPGPDDSSSAAPDTATCTNDQAGYSVEYPATWHTNSGEVTAPCTLFDREPIQAEEGTEATTAITMSVSGAGFRNASANDAFGDVRSRDSAVVDEREAVAVVDEATGQAMLDEGTLSYTWVINLADGAFVASTREAEGRDFQANSDVLDDMISSMDFSAPAPNDSDGDEQDGNADEGDGDRTVVAEYEFGEQPFHVDVVQRADEMCLVARSGESAGNDTCLNPSAVDDGLTVRSLDVPGGPDALGGFAAADVERVLAANDNEGTVGFRTTEIAGTDSRAWAMPLEQSATDRVIGYNGEREMVTALDAEGEPTSVLPNVNTEPESTQPSDDVRLLDEVETGLHAGYDRVAFRFENGVPGYEAGYEQRPIEAAGSGTEVEINGENVVVMRMEQASGRERSGDGEQTYTGPERLAGAGTYAMTEVVRTGDFEGVLTWAVGANDKLPFRVRVFDGVLVVDVRHPEA